MNAEAPAGARLGEGAVRAEWLEADGLGGFASGTASLIRTRRYHALLLAASTPPTGRYALVNGLEAWVDTEGGRVPISSQRYAPNVTHPDGASRLASFTASPWPSWRWDLGGGLFLRHELFVPRGRPLVALSWQLETRAPAKLSVRPLLSVRDCHALHHENGAFRFEADLRDGRIVWHPYGPAPAVAAWTNGRYTQAPEWYRNFQYDRERDRGLDFTEDLASPGLLRWDLERGEAVLLLTVEGEEAGELFEGEGPVALVGELRAAERERRAGFPSDLARAGDAYLVRRGEGDTVVAGYPWFTDWGRDTFISLRGLCLAQGRVAQAAAILGEWSRHVSQGMLPNRFPEGESQPEYNSADASLWFVIAVRETLAASPGLAEPERQRLLGAADAVLGGYAAGTRFGIGLDDDGLLAAGTPETNLTWMDARFEGRPVTARAGKPVELQALWLNALWLHRDRSPRWLALFDQGRRSFHARFWNQARGCLFDVVDVEGRHGTADGTLRPNQIFAVGGLPLALLDGARARSVVDVVEAQLWTPLGLRSLAPGEPGYRGRYQGGLRERDEAYHQGTVWTWLAGPFIEAWRRVRGDGPEARREADERWVRPLIEATRRGGLGHLPEIADGDPPHEPRGCPFQAWSMGELLRVSKG